MSIEEATIVPAGKVPVGHTLFAAYATLLRYLWPFAQIALFPLALGVLLPYLFAKIYPPLYDGMVELFGYEAAVTLNSLNPQGLVERVVAWLALIVFMSHWLQFLDARKIGGKTTGDKVVMVRVFSRNDLRVLSYGLLLLIPTVCAVLVQLLGTLLSTGHVTAEPLRRFMASAESSPVLFLLTVAAIDAFVAGRSAPVFAAATVGEPLSLHQAWRMTRGQTLRLMLLWLILFTITYALGGALQSVMNDLYVALIIAIHQPGQFIGFYYSPPFTQLITLPSAAVHCAAMALAARVLWQVYRSDAAARDKLLKRFE